MPPPLAAPAKRRARAPTRGAARIAALGALALACGTADIRLAPPALGDGIAVSTPGAEGIDSAGLSAAYARLRRAPFDGTRSLLVARNGRLVAEGYLGGRGADDRANVKSVTKSVTALLTGLAIHDQALRGVRQPIAELLPDLALPDTDPRRDAITVEDLLTMRAGLRWNEWANGFADPNGMYAAPRSIPYVLHREMERDPGERFTYSTGTSQLLAGVLQRALRRPVDEYAQERLFQPLGIRRVRWQRHRDGTPYGGVGLELTPRELLKLGLLVANGGRWQGRQVVPANWVDAATRRHVGVPRGTGGYGYGWWVRSNAYWAEGYGGQYIYVVPTARLVVVLTADPERAEHIDVQTFDLVLADILRAARELP